MFPKSILNLAQLQTLPITSTVSKRFYQIVRNVEPNPTPEPAPIVSSGLPFRNYPLSEQECILPKEPRVTTILKQVKATDGLPPSPSHIEHLVGRATKGRIYQKQGLFPEEKSVMEHEISSGLSNFPMNLNENQEKYEVGGVDIAEKTQLILQSPHPVRYVIEREINNSQRGLRSHLPSYHTWIMVFGRSLVSRYRRTYDEKYDILLNNIANASDSGMFSADIHHTIIDIPENHPSFANSASHFHMGNKYAVLVGDYFAIRCIYYAERTKTNSVMVSITEGVEDFTTCSFGTNLFDRGVGYPFLLSSQASINDWVRYNKKAYGYFKGGLHAALSLHQNRQNQSWQNLAERFAGNFATFLKAAVELDSLQRNDSLVPSPFLLTSLPAILFQSEKPETFSSIRQYGYDLDVNRLKELHEVIRGNSTAMEQTRSLMVSLANETKQSFLKIAKDEYYINVFDSLVEAVVDAV